MKTIAIFLAFLLASTSLNAQERVGTAIVKGQTVDLFSDNTWRLRGEAVASDCISITPQVRFCGADGKWGRALGTDAEGRIQWRYDERTYGLAIVENIGASEGVTARYMLRNAIESAAEFSGVSPESVPVIDVLDYEIHELPATRVVYSVELEGLPIVYVNTIIIGNDVTMQAITYSIAPTFSDQQDELHRDFVSRFEIN